MNLIEKVYENNSVVLEENSPFVYFNDLGDIDKLMSFLKYARSFDTDLSYEEMDANLVKLFGKLGFGLNDSICLHNMKIGSSKYNVNQEGYCEFNYSVNTLEYEKGNIIGYYSSSELFDGTERYSTYPGVKLSSGNESLYYTVGTGPYIRKYSIKLNEEVTLIREYSNDEAFFMFEGIENTFIIRVKKPLSKIVTGNYVLDNELELVNYLRSLSSYDMVEIYNKLREISLGEDVSKYPEIFICESIKKENIFEDVNSVCIKNGDVDSIVRTVGDREITCYGNGNWSYMLSDENITFRINSGKTLRYGIETKSDKSMDEYTDTLLKYDVGTARREVEDTKRLVREKFGLSVKKRG